MTYSFASELYSKIATLDKGTLAAVVFGLLLGAIVIKSIFSSIFAKKPPATFRCARVGARCRMTNARLKPGGRANTNSSAKIVTINGVKRIRQYAHRLAAEAVVACCL